MAVEKFVHLMPMDGRRGNRRSTALFDALQREIVLGLLPPHETLRELDLAERFACSQGTVREALLRLNEEGLVNREPHRGTHVSYTSPEEAAEFIQLRHDTECRGAARAASNFGPALRDGLMASLDAMVEAAAADDEYLLSLHDRAFHLRLFETAGLPNVRPILQRCLVHNHRYKILNTEGPRDLVETAERHRGIITALEEGDTAQLVSVLSHHIATIVDLGPNLISIGQVPGLSLP